MISINPSRFQSGLNWSSMGVVDAAHVSESKNANASETTSSLDPTIKVSPLPLPEQIIQLVIDEILQEKERAVAAFAHEDSQSTSNAIDRAFRFDADLKSLCLVSRLWTHPARCALGRRFVLILDEKRLPRLPLALENPLYGPWTTQIDLLEIPCVALRDRQSVDGVWSLIQRVVGRLENIRSFTVNSRILWSSGVRLPSLLPRFKILEEFVLINTGIIVTSDSTELYQKLANLSFELPLLRRMTYIRCLSVGDSNSEPDCQPLTSQGSANLSDQLQAIKTSLFSSFNCCFMASLVSFVFDRDEMRWLVDELTATHLRSICHGQCNYNDPSGVCASIRSLRIVGDSKRITSPCIANLLRNFHNVKVLHLSLQMLPDREVLDALPSTLEEAVFKIKGTQMECDLWPFDDRLSRFCHTHRSKLRRLEVALGEIECSNHGTSLPLTDTFCQAHDVKFAVLYEPHVAPNYG
ncbi:hypothetical protein SCHPADRAFT_88378 [Schizopora paradoxa]|uniref:Uncharacterized protein n=1 Tax=Schizopora paradoxa TaxID=27342 RepID=A0A0H2SPR0_9AGAM|nr:hypothetical protein SCHPADRAFT_88378 [Schizopora paradoxa]